MTNSCPPGMSFGAWLRDKNLHVGAPVTVKKRFRAWDSSLDAYASAVRQGVEPDTTRREDVDRAMRVSEATGVAYGS